MARTSGMVMPTTRPGRMSSVQRRHNGCCPGRLCRPRLRKLTASTIATASISTLLEIADEVLKNPSRFVDILREKRDFLSANYETCTQEIENEGHRFGEDLSEADKKALTAFLATL